MDILEYLNRREESLERRHKRLLDARVFDFNYMPPKPLLREEVKPVVDAVLRFSGTGIGNHLLLTGSRGSGKTLSVRYLASAFQDRDLRILYCNCRIHNSSYKILAHLMAVRARGLSFDELAARFGDAYPAKTVVILDEIDLLSERDKRKDILYFLSRSEANYMTILLSNNPRWISGLDESIQSTLQPESIYYRPYTPDELREILHDRAHHGVHRVPERVVHEIAALTTKLAHSDVRVALKTLFYWAVEPDAPLKENFQRARRDLVVDVVRNLSDKNLLILKAAIGDERPVKSVYSDYKKLCAQYHEEPFSYVHFHSSLAYLQNLGLVVLMSTKIRRTYAKLVQLTFPADLLQEFWRLRFE